MKLITYRSSDGSPTVGLVDSEDTVHDLTSALGVTDLIDAIGRTAELKRWTVTDGAGLPLAGLELLAPIPRPRRNIFCIGKNYADHANEVPSGSGGGGGDQTPTKPIVFTKPPSSVIGTGAAIESHPTLTSELDYEAELAVIIGIGGRDIRASDAAAHVWGYTIVNDVTARDRQREHKQFFLGKGLDTFCPMGPFAISAEEVDADGAARPTLGVQTRVNGELRQDGSTSQLLFDIPTLIETISAGLTLEVGDIIATGTPAGVGAGFTPPRFLSPGDVVEVTIERLGTLTNTVR